MKPSLTIALLLAAILAGCGGNSLKDQINTEMGAGNVKWSKCGAENAGPRYDGWCSVQVKDVGLFVVPYRDDKLLWQAKRMDESG